MNGISAEPSPSPDLTNLYQYGAVGILALLALWAAWVLYKRSVASADRERAQLIASHDRERTQLLEQIRMEQDQTKAEKERADRLEMALADLNNTVRDQVMVVLSEAQRAVTDAIARMRR